MRGENVCESGGCGGGGGGGLIVGKEKRVGPKWTKYEPYRFGLVWFGLVWFSYGGRMAG